MAIPAGVLNKIDRGFDNVAPVIMAQEDIYFATYGHYWQGILTPPVVPVDGTDTTPDLTLHPTDQTMNWLEFASQFSATTFPFSAFVHVHNGPDGQGYTMGAIVYLSDGTVWIRTQAVNFYGDTAGQWLPQVP